MAATNDSSANGQNDSAEAVFEGVMFWAGSKVIGRLCREEIDTYMECSQALTSMSSNSGAKGNIHTQELRITECSKNALLEIHRTCKPSFDTFSDCLRKNNLNFHKCRLEEKAFYACWNNDRPLNLQVKPGKVKSK